MEICFIYIFYPHVTIITCESPLIIWTESLSDFKRIGLSYNQSLNHYKKIYHLKPYKSLVD